MEAALVRLGGGARGGGGGGRRWPTPVAAQRGAAEPPVIRAAKGLQRGRAGRRLAGEVQRPRRRLRPEQEATPVAGLRLAGRGAGEAALVVSGDRGAAAVGGGWRGDSWGQRQQCGINF